MAFTPPPISELCKDLPTPPAIPQVQFPSGITLKGSFPGGEFPTTLGLATNLLTQAGPLMGSLSPFFKMLDVVIELFNTVKAIPESILQLNPEPIISALVDLTAAIAEVVKLIPQLSVPVMIVNLIDLIITFLNGIVPELQVLATAQAKADGLNQLAQITGDPRLQASVACLQNNIDQQLAALSASLGPIGQIMEVMNILMQVAGLGTLPALGSFTDPASGVVLLQGFVNTITDIRNAIPI